MGKLATCSLPSISIACVTFQAHQAREIFLALWKRFVFSWCMCVHMCVHVCAWYVHTCLCVQTYMCLCNIPTYSICLKFHLISPKSTPFTNTHIHTHFTWLLHQKIMSLDVVWYNKSGSVETESQKHFLRLWREMPFLPISFLLAVGMPSSAF